MSYTVHNFVAGQNLTAAQMNEIDAGIAALDPANKKEWIEIAASSTSEPDKVAAISEGTQIRFGNGADYKRQVKIFPLKQGKTYKVYGFGYDRSSFWVALLGTTDMIAEGAAYSPYLSTVLCGTDVYPDGFGYHTVIVNPAQDCFVYVNYRYDQDEATCYEYQGSEPSLRNGVYINNGVYTHFHEDGGTYILREFQRRGPNNLFQWSALKLGEVDSVNGVTPLETIASFGTDIVGPFNLLNSTLFPGQSEGWTGGNHGKTIDSTTYATAEQHNFKCLVNGVEKTANGLYYGDVLFVAENYIYFPQSVTGADLSSAAKVVTERREYFLDDQMRVRVRLHFDNAATVSTYYGMQAVTVGFDDILFANNEAYYTLANVSAAVNLTEKEREILLTAANGLHFDMELLDRGLGTYKHNTATNTAYAVLPIQTGSNRNQKVYYKCMNNASIASGADMVWEGIYSLYFA